jgi:hypothetical protein
MAKRWWTDDPNERYWLEATDRTDIGTDLHAPLADSAGRDNWRYTLFREAAVGDIVFHYDGKTNAIVARSVIAGAPTPITTKWAARGSYARARGAEPEELEGYSMPLRDAKMLVEPVTLEAIRAARPALEDVVSALRARHGKAPLYFPFELGARPIRPMQGYAFKFPAAAARTIGLASSQPADTFTISSNRRLVTRSFAKWREALLEGAVREPRLWRQPAERFVFTNQPERGSTRLGQRTALGVDPAGEVWAVQINEADTPGDINVTTAIATDASGRRYLLRQGRLNSNSQSPKPILYPEFRRYSGLAPVKVINGDTTIVREWYLVTALDLHPAAIRQNTANFVDACVMARTRGQGAGNAEDLARAGEIAGNDERGGKSRHGARPALPEREVQRRQGEVWQRMVLVLRPAGVSVTKVRHADGYEIDAEIVKGRRRLLVEIKTGTSAEDIYAGLGQLKLYAKLFLRLSSHTPVLLLPGWPRQTLADAVKACDVTICTFDADFDNDPVQVTFSRGFLKMCGAA